MNIWLSPVGTKWEVRAKMIKLLIKSWQFGANYSRVYCWLPALVTRDGGRDIYSLDHIMRNTKRRSQITMTLKNSIELCGVACIG